MLPLASNHETFGRLANVNCSGEHILEHIYYTLYMTFCSTLHGLTRQCANYVELKLVSLYCPTCLLNLVMKCAMVL